MNYKLMLLFVLLGPCSSSSEEFSVAKQDTCDIFARATSGLVKLLDQSVTSVDSQRQRGLSTAKSTGTQYVRTLESYKQDVRGNIESLVREKCNGSFNSLKSTVNSTFNTIWDTAQSDFHIGVRRFSIEFGPIVELKPELKPKFLSTMKELISKGKEIFDQINETYKGLTQEFENEQASTLASLKL